MAEEQNVEVQNNTNEEKTKKGKSVAAMILGIVSLVSSCIWWVSIPCGIIGLILGIIGKKSESAKKMAVTGIVLSAISIGLALLLILGLASIIGFGMASTY